MTSFASGDKLGELADGDGVSLSIDTEAFPYRGLRMAGRIALDPVDGLSSEYRQAAARYLGAEVGQQWCDSLGGRPQVRIVMNPETASTWDLSGSAFVAGATPN